MDMVSGLLPMLAGWLHTSPEFMGSVVLMLFAMSEVLGSFEMFKSSSVFELVKSWLVKAKDVFKK